MSVYFNDLSQELQEFFSALIPGISVIANGEPTAIDFICAFNANATTVQDLTGQLTDLYNGKNQQ
jgi:hypothetical protein